jgi:hypothetical protein
MAIPPNPQQVFFSARDAWKGHGSLRVLPQPTSAARRGRNVHVMEDFARETRRQRQKQRKETGSETEKDK